MDRSISFCYERVVVDGKIREVPLPSVNKIYNFRKWKVSSRHYFPATMREEVSSAEPVVDIDYYAYSNWNVLELSHAGDSPLRILLIYLIRRLPLENRAARTNKILFAQVISELLLFFNRESLNPIPGEICLAQCWRLSLFLLLEKISGCAIEA